MAGFDAAVAQLTPDQFLRQTIQHRLDVVFWVSVAFFSICLWDTVLRFPMELRLVYLPELKMIWQRKPKTPHVTPILLILCRSAALMTIVSSFFLQRQPESCQASLTVSAAGFALGTTCCLGIFAYRTIAIRRSRWPLRVFLWANVGCLGTIWLYWAFYLRISQKPIPDLSNVYGPTCYNVINTPVWLYIYLWTALFELIVLGLTLSATLLFKDLSITNARMRARAISSVTKQFLTDAGTYFALSFTVHIAEFAWTFTHQEDHIYAGLMLPVHGVVVFVIGPRVIANLKATIDVAKVTTATSNDNHSMRATGIGSIARSDIRLHPQGLISSTSIFVDNPILRAPTQSSFSGSSSGVRSNGKVHDPMPPVYAGKVSSNFQRRPVNPPPHELSRPPSPNFSYPVQEPPVLVLDKPQVYAVPRPV